MSLADRLARALAVCRRTLADCRHPEGHWEGELSSSALSTATAACALALFQQRSLARAADVRRLIEKAIRWLVRHQNSDGGWGDTAASLSNASATALVWAALNLTPEPPPLEISGARERAEAWLAMRVGGLEPSRLAEHLAERYGTDRTFSIPILTTCALAGCLGSAPDCWRHVHALPFELAAFPARWYAALRLPVVSYALPALIAIGQARHAHAPPKNPFLRWARNLARARTLETLRSIQPSSGGFLEATPLTSFVSLSLISIGLADHPVTRRALEFLIRSARDDGSWPIDTNLATWLTTLAIEALDADAAAPEESWASVRAWLLGQQCQSEHPYTHAAPGGWAWTPLPGGVPDADDTAGALLALHKIAPDDPAVQRAARLGLRWLLGLQNKDGGIPTFCRGWGTLPFDRSSPDLTAHAIRAWRRWRPAAPESLRRRISAALARAEEFLERRQKADGSWIPLWFGNERHAQEENPVYGASRVLIALADWQEEEFSETRRRMIERGIQYLAGCQNRDGSWSPWGPATVEETAWAVEGLAAARAHGANRSGNARGDAALGAGINRLLDWVESDRWRQPAPVGFYFAKLWYSEKLYPLIFTAAALRRAAESAVTPRPLPAIECA